MMKRSPQSHIQSTASERIAPEPKFISKRQVAELIGVSIYSIDRYRRSYPDFPRPVTLSNCTLRFPRAEVDAWLERRRQEGCR
jgi:predicted DNA-binding transcriptional regulator AlpA